MPHALRGRVLRGVLGREGLEERTGRPGLLVCLSTSVGHWADLPSPSWAVCTIGVRIDPDSPRRPSGYRREASVFNRASRSFVAPWTGRHESSDLLRAKRPNQASQNVGIGPWQVRGPSRASEAVSRRRRAPSSKHGRLDLLRLRLMWPEPLHRSIPVQTILQPVRLTRERTKGSGRKHSELAFGSRSSSSKRRPKPTAGRSSKVSRREVGRRQVALPASNPINYFSQCACSWLYGIVIIAGLRKG